MKIRKYKNIIISIALIILFAAAIYVFMPSRAADGQNDYMIEENGNLEYYITVMYDGKDETATTSSPSATASVFSDYIYVEDKLPEGVTYNGLVTPTGQTAANWDCTYGAVEQGNETRACSGYVVGAQKVNGQCTGISYDSTTRIVSFAVKGLKAGCKLTVGIKTTTQTLGNNDRRDLFNTAYAWEEMFTAKSNPVHVFMGDIDAPTFNSVSYSYSSTINGVTFPEVPSTETHTPGVEVGVAREPVLEGYEFSGWTTQDATVSNGKFTMPNSNVAFTGTFTKKTDYTVTYTVNPSTSETGYVPPSVKTYGAGDNVSIEEIDEDYIIGEYTFDGWTTNDVTSLASTTFKSGSFKMPSHNVVISGTFSPKRYNVTYAYKGSVPSGINPPSQASYAVGSQVTLPEVSTIPQGYSFLGWYSPNQFTMPNDDITIYGEWVQVLPTFAPTISVTKSTNVINSNENITFTITIENNEEYDITDVVVKPNLAGCYFVEGEPGEEEYYSIFTINEIESESSVTLTAVYSAELDHTNDEYIRAVISKFKIASAIGDSDHEFYTDDEIAATASFTVSDLVLNINTVTGTGQNETALSGTAYKLCTDSAATTCLMENNQVIEDTQFDHVGVGTYYLKQVLTPSGYMAFAGPATVVIDNDGTVTATGLTVTAGNNGVRTIKVVNDELIILPYTGGVGNIPFIIGGLVIIVGGSIWFIYYYRNKDKKKKSERKKGGGKSNEK